MTTFHRNPAALAVTVAAAAGFGASVAALASAPAWAVAVLAALAGVLALLALARLAAERDAARPRSGVVSALVPDAAPVAEPEPGLAPPPAPVVRPNARARSRLDDDPWMGLVEDVVELVDELDRLGDGLPDGQRDLVDHVVARLTEILRRADVDVISGQEPFDRQLHAPAGGPGAARGMTILETYSPGFSVEERVLRRARVRVEGP